jgi:hypothetical protein
MNRRLQTSLFALAIQAATIAAVPGKAATVDPALGNADNDVANAVDPFGGAKPVTDAELKEERGGFNVPGVGAVDIGIQSVGTLNGQTVFTQTITPTPTGLQQTLQVNPNIPNVQVATPAGLAALGLNVPGASGVIIGTGNVSGNNQNGNSNSGNASNDGNTNLGGNGNTHTNTASTGSGGAANNGSTVNTGSSGGAGGGVSTLISKITTLPNTTVTIVGAGQGSGGGSPNVNSNTSPAPNSITQGGSPAPQQGFTALLVNVTPSQLQNLVVNTANSRSVGLQTNVVIGLPDLLANQPSLNLGALSMALNTALSTAQLSAFHH